MKHLFQAWRRFSSAIEAASHVLLLSDYDGTLTPIVSRPRDAVLSPAVREKLRNLAEMPYFTLGIISGRALPDVKQLVGLDGIYYAGNHGLEIEGPGLEYTNDTAKAAQSEMKEIAARLAGELSGIGGVVIENKALSLSLHYRLVKPGEEKKVADIFRSITAPLLAQGKIRTSSGKKVLEIRPPIDWDKGKAVETIAREIGTVLGSEVGPVIYLGDDTTDEDAFKVLRSPSGWSIFVGPENPSSRAEYFLESTAEVETFLDRLLELSKAP